MPKHEQTILASKVNYCWVPHERFKVGIKMCTVMLLDLVCFHSESMAVLYCFTLFYNCHIIL